MILIAESRTRVIKSGVHLGNAGLMARATDARGHTQPLERDPHRGNYVITHIQPIEVEVQ